METPVQTDSKAAMDSALKNTSAEIVTAAQPMQTAQPNEPVAPAHKIYCRHCGEVIDDDCVACPKCGKQVQQR